MSRVGGLADRPTNLWTSRLLWEACRRNPRPDAVLKAIANGANVVLASEASVRHRISPLLWRALHAAGLVDALGAAKADFGALADVHRMEALILFPRATAMSLGPLTEGGLEPVVLKGPSIAARYPEPGLRPMDDIDLLLPRHQHEEALRLLTNAGWQVLRYSARDHYDTVLTHPGVPSLALELHYGLEANWERTTTLDPETLWERRLPIDCLGTPAFGLPLAEEIVTVAAHAGKPFHGFTRLLWIADLSMIVGRACEVGSGVDWQRVRSFAEEGHCTTVVGAALGLARHAGLDFPTDLFPIPKEGWRGSALTRLLDSAWPLETSEIPTFHIRYALVDGWLRRVRLLLASGHQMSPRTRVKWMITAPGDAVSRWWALRRGSLRT